MLAHHRAVDGDGPSAIRSAAAATRRVRRSVTLVATVLAGTLLPAQFATNAALAGAFGSVVLTAAISYTVGALLLTVLVATNGRRPDWTAARHAPPWAWLGGVVGSAYVVSSLLLTRALGAALATLCVIVAQLLAAIAFDHLGAFGLPRRRINGARLVAVALALAALGTRLWSTR